MGIPLGNDCGSVPQAASPASEVDARAQAAQHLPLGLALEFLRQPGHAIEQPEGLGPQADACTQTGAGALEIDTVFRGEIAAVEDMGDIGAQNEARDQRLGPARDADIALPGDLVAQPQRALLAHAEGKVEPCAHQRLVARPRLDEGPRVEPAEGEAAAKLAVDYRIKMVPELILRRLRGRRREDPVHGFVEMRDAGRGADGDEAEAEPRLDLRRRLELGLGSEMQHARIAPIAGRWMAQHRGRDDRCTKAIFHDLERAGGQRPVPAHAAHHRDVVAAGLPAVLAVAQIVVVEEPPHAERRAPGQIDLGPDHGGREKRGKKEQAAQGGLRAVRHRVCPALAPALGRRAW
ncbi:hypothetical protein SDC9_34379 [bioreactor metagenome]|uniref:Uncharacterized protein n=1 Tax=bioreactor metagenome TaxID=1076179 RepID=A0A644VAI9_9ZZZZ